MKKSIRVVLIIFVLLIWLIRLFEDTSPEPDPDDESSYYVMDDECEEFINDDRLMEVEPERIIQRSWVAYEYTNNYCAQYPTRQRIQDESESFRNGIRIYYDGDYIKFWNRLYANLYQHDADKLISLQDSLQNLAVKRNLSREDFAALIVSFVQDIPYEFVMPDACTGTERKPCNGNVQFGIYSPVEFMHKLKGDCDTRTVLLYTLLENFGYDAVIFISRQYEHSMLGIDLLASGDHKRYKGKNYYFWETTNVGWMPGVIPPDMNNVRYWHIALD